MNISIPSLDPIAQTLDYVTALQGRRRDGSIPTSADPPIFLGSDTLGATVSLGKNLPSLFAPTVTWIDAGTARALLRIAAAQSATLAYDSTYIVTVTVTRGGVTFPLAIAQLPVLPAPGGLATVDQTIAPYCTPDDLEEYDSGIKAMRDQAADQDGFYTQRLQARRWMDDAIINNYRGATVGNFEMHSVMAFNFGGGAGMRRALGPSPAMIKYLADDMLIVRPQIVEACAYKALSIVGLKQVGRDAMAAARGAYFRDMASRAMTGITAEIDTNGDGVGEIFVNLGSTNPLMT